MVVYRSPTVGIGAGRALLVWPVGAATPMPVWAIPASCVVVPPFRWCSAVEAHALFAAHFANLQWAGPADVAQLRRHLDEDTQESIRAAQNAA